MLALWIIRYILVYLILTIHSIAYWGSDTFGDIYTPDVITQRSLHPQLTKLKRSLCYERLDRLQVYLTLTICSKVISVIWNLLCNLHAISRYCAKYDHPPSTTTIQARKLSILSMFDIIQLLTNEALDMMWYRPENTHIDRGKAEVNMEILWSISHHIQCLISQ